MRWSLPTGIALLGLAMLLVHTGIVFQMAERVVVADRLHEHLAQIQLDFGDLDQRQHADVHELTDDVLEMYAQLGEAFEQAASGREAGGSELDDTSQRQTSLMQRIDALTQAGREGEATRGAAEGDEAVADELIEVRREHRFTGWLIAYALGGAAAIVGGTALGVVGALERDSRSRDRASPAPTLVDP